MTTIITALIYSGKPNPSWELTDQQTEQLKSILTEQKDLTRETSAQTAGLLGYSGFLIESYEESLPAKTFCFDGIIDIADQPQANIIDKESSLESFLLSTGQKQLSEPEKGYIGAEISKNASGGPGSVSKVLSADLDMTVPPYDPGKWNIPGVQRYNNCYNYANDKITNTFAQPGRGSGSTIGDTSCGTVTAAAQRDGQVSVSDSSSTPVEGHFIALVSSPIIDDYHWYRLDANGMWSHKPGQTPAKNTDNFNQLISDPRSCNRGPYTDFCGFFYCNPSQTTIR